MKRSQSKKTYVACGECLMTQWRFFGVTRRLLCLPTRHFSINKIDEVLLGFYLISILFHFRTAQRSFIRSCWTAGMLNGTSDRSFQKLWRNSTSWFDLLINSTKILVQFPGKIACIDTIILPYSHFTVDSSLFHSYLLHFQWLKITQNDFNPLTPRGDKHLTSPYNIRTLSSKQVIRKLKLIG